MQFKFCNFLQNFECLLFVFFQNSSFGPIFWFEFEILIALKSKFAPLYGIWVIFFSLYFLYIFFRFRPRLLVALPAGLSIHDMASNVDHSGSKRIKSKDEDILGDWEVFSISNIQLNLFLFLKFFNFT